MSGKKKQDTGNCDEGGIEYTPLTMLAFDCDVPPDGCIACGGPYPDCKSSCAMFDND